MNMTKKNLIFALLMVATLGSFAYAQQVIITKASSAVPVGGSITADDTQSTAVLIRYIGTNAGGGEVAVAAAGQISLTVATVADTSVECPVSGGLGGIIDTTNAGCNTLGEVCDAINGVNGAGGATAAAPSNFRCVILDGLRGDSSDNSLFAFTIVPADAKAGLPIFWDADSVHLSASLALVPPEARSIDFYLGPAPAYALKPFPFKNTRTFADFAWEDSSTCTGADTFRITAANDYTYGAETPVNVYGPIATNTTTPVTFTLPQGGVFGKYGAKLVARETCATTFAGGLLAVSAYQVPLAP
jgi:hypothetical protein